jgi:hypothetical protein
MINLIKTILDSDTEIKVIYDSERIFEYDDDSFYSGDATEISFEELDEDYLKFAIFEEIEVSTDIKEFLKLLNTIKKTFGTQKQKYWLTMNDFEDIISDEAFEELYDLSYLIEHFYDLQIFEVQYLDVKKVRTILNDTK